MKKQREEIVYAVGLPQMGGVWVSSDTHIFRDYGDAVAFQETRKDLGARVFTMFLQNPVKE